jgi:hypothetical protein
MRQDSTKSRTIKTIPAAFASRSGPSSGGHPLVKEGLSERRACKLIGQPRSTQRRLPAPYTGNDA